MIYLIDDDITSLNFMGLIVRKLGRTFEHFTDPLLALTRVREQAPEVVITDLVMPKLDGFAVMDEVKKVSPRTAVVLLTGQSEIDSAIDAIRRGACDYVTKPVNPDRLLAAIELAEDSYMKSALVTREDAYSLEVASLQSQLRQLNDNAKGALVSALDARERETKQHSVRVSLYAAYLAQQLGLPFPRIEAIRTGALLHDIGKIGVPDSVLSKPAALNSEEWKIMRRHPEIGYQIVKGLIGESEGAQIVLCHHERFDGGGYPAGLAGDEIPIGARIFSVVDAYDALTSPRPYREPVPHWTAAREIVKNAESQFDPYVVECFIKIPKQRWSRFAKDAEEMVAATMEPSDGSESPEAALIRAAGITL